MNDADAACKCNAAQSPTAGSKLNAYWDGIRLHLRRTLKQGKYLELNEYVDKKATNLTL
jgi:hypothetical protein